MQVYNSATDSYNLTQYVKETGAVSTQTVSEPRLTHVSAGTAHICAGTGRTAPTFAPGLGPPRPHLRRV